MACGQSLEEVRIRPHIVPLLEALGPLEGAHKVCVEVIVVLGRDIYIEYIL